jgi:hypothetical protein
MTLPLSSSFGLLANNAIDKSSKRRQNSLKPALQTHLVLSKAKSSQFLYETAQGNQSTQLLSCAKAKEDGTQLTVLLMQQFAVL